MIYGSKNLDSSFLDFATSACGHDLVDSDSPKKQISTIPYFQKQIVAAQGLRASPAKPADRSTMISPIESRRWGSPSGHRCRKNRLSPCRFALDPMKGLAREARDVGDRAKARPRSPRRPAPSQEGRNSVHFAL